MLLRITINRVAINKRSSSPMIEKAARLFTSYIEDRSALLHGGAYNFLAESPKVSKRTHTYESQKVASPLSAYIRSLADFQ